MTPPRWVNHQLPTMASKRISLALAMLLTASLAVLSTAASLQAWALGVPELVVPDNIAVAQGQNVQVTVSFNANNADVTATGFSLDIDPACLSFSNTDADNNYIPDAVQFHTPASFSPSASYNMADTDGELDLTIIDFNPPYAQIPNGPLVTITFGTVCTPPPGSFSVTPALFSLSPTASFGNSLAQNVTGSTDSGSVRINSSVPATSTPTNTSTNTPTNTPFNTLTATPTGTGIITATTTTPSVTATAIKTVAPVKTPTPTGTNTVVPTRTATATPNATRSPTPTATDEVGGFGDDAYFVPFVQR